MKQTININRILCHGILFYFFFSILLVSGCKKLAEVEVPDTRITDLNVYANDATATAVLTGLYIRMSSASLRSNSIISLPVLTGLSGDELTLYEGANNETYSAFYLNGLTAMNIGYPNCWTDMYKNIFTCNSAIEGVTASSALTPAVKTQLLGEAKFMRAFNYFYLTNLFGDVPLTTSTDYTVNASLPRTAQSEIYKFIIGDLIEAQQLLADDYLDVSLINHTNERIRPTKWAATALLARAYLYSGDNLNAENAATEVISNNALYGLTPLSDVFLKNSTEAIWQLQPVNNDYNTEDARLYVIPSTGPSPDWPVYISDHLLTAFEDGDQRKTEWINNFTDTTAHPNIVYNYPYKYKVAEPFEQVTEYSTILRLAEVFLIRSEARARQSKTAEAAADLNTIRQRSGLGNTTAASESDLLNAILRERRVELFAEWGHRWLDLKRFNKINDIMNTVTQQKGGTWNANWSLYPIPADDIIKDPKIIQNPGY